MEFQFHKGTIKTDEVAEIFKPYGEFQFHKGTIKTLVSRGCSLVSRISIP